MVNELDVFEVLKQMTSISESGIQPAIDLCAQCFDSLKKELRDNADTEDQRIINAAAAKAFYLICLKEKSAEQDGVTSFKAGDISITQQGSDINGKLKAAESLYREERERIIPLLIDNGFFAGKVDI